MNAISKSRTTFYWILTFLLLLTYGCALPINTTVTGASNNLPHGLQEIDNSFWWRCQFKIVVHNNEPNWAVDLLLAHSVVSPALSQFADDIPYWRFHRRAAPDDAGHQFTFLFYSKPEVASSVFAAINKNEVLKDTLEANLLSSVHMNNPGKPQHPNIGDTSDPHWSPELQKHWPSYIMGVSALWLGLIIEDMQHSAQSSNDVNRLLDEYRQVDTNISGIWRDEGQHALLHHLNAIFGYQPLLLKKKMQF